MERLYVENLTKIFGLGTKHQVIAVKDVTFDVKKGEIVALLGPSGCGKTTTLRCIAGLETPTSGKIFIDGEDVTEQPPNKRDIGMVFQFAVVYDTISVYENIILPLKAKKFQENEIKQRVIEIAELLNLNDYLDKRAKGLDIAVRQRIALARALVKQPRLLLLDEPLTPLDPISRVKLRTDLKRLQKEKNLTAIYVTHDQSEAITLADRVAVMNEGRLIQFDKPENIYLHPANTFVAKFIGEPGMNLIESSIVKYEGKIFLQIGNQTVFLDRFLDLEDKCDQIKDVILGIRPEHIKIRSIKGDLKGVITLVEIHGNRSLVHVDIGGVEIVVKHPTIFKDKSHEEVWLELQKDKIVLFDKENKANLNLRR